VDRQALRAGTLSLLGSSDIDVAWRDCGADDPCAHDGPRRGVTVIVTPAARRDCGTTALEPDRASATVLVSLPCVSAVVDALSRAGRNRLDPRLASLRREHVLAAVIAHELGHAMGLPHAEAGVMRARLGIEEILALRQGWLAFSPLEATRMRASRLSVEAMIAAGRRDAARTGSASR
jgi:hypothetical protein